MVIRDDKISSKDPRLTPQWVNRLPALWILFVACFFFVQPADAGQAILSWNTPTTNENGTPLTNLSGYKIYYGTSSGNYGAGIDVGNVTTHTVTGLTDNTTYYFAVTAYNTSGNESLYSNEVSKTLLDATPPAISNVTISSLTVSSATITWTTDEASTSQIDYGTTTSYGSSTTVDSNFVTSHSVVLSGLSTWTDYHLRVKSQDAAGNLATSSDSTFTTLGPPSDTTPPTGSVSINSGAASTNTTSVTLNLSCADETTTCWQMQFSNNGTTWSALEAYATTKAWTLSTGDGAKTVYVRYQDSSANTSIAYTDLITLDATVPTGTVSVNNGSASINTALVTLALACTDSGSGCSQMQFSNTGTSWSTLEVYATTKAWTLSTGNGTKTVYARFVDGSGNTSTSYSDQIVLDTAVPTGSIVINGGAAVTNTTSVTLTLSCSDTTTGCGQMQFSSNASTWSTLETYATTKAWTLSSGDGTKTVYARYQDGAGNTSTSSTDQITLDSAAPSISNIQSSNITDTLATITWTTNESSTSQVEFGTSASLGLFSANDTNLVTSHSVALTGLNPATTYHFKVHSTDSVGNAAISSENIFVTLQTVPAGPPSAIQDLRVRAGVATRSSLYLDWTATGADADIGTASNYDLRMSKFKIVEDGAAPASGEVIFSNATQVPGVPAPQQAGTPQSVLINGLETNTVYYFAIKATDDQGNQSAISNIVNGNNIPPVPVTAVRQGYTMISFPLVPSTSDVQTLLGGITGSPVELYTWSSSGFDDPNSAFVVEQNVVPGYGYFLKTDISTAVLNIGGTPVTDSSRPIPLQAGWNMIGNPYSTPVNVTNVQIRNIGSGEIKTYADAVVAGWVGNAVYPFDGSTYGFVTFTDGVLQPWQGYWVAVLQDGLYELVISKP